MGMREEKCACIYTRIRKDGFEEGKDTGTDGCEN